MIYVYVQVELDDVRDSEEALKGQLEEKESSISALNKEIKALKDRIEKSNGHEKALETELGEEKAKSSNLGRKIETLAEVIVPVVHRLGSRGKCFLRKLRPTRTVDASLRLDSLAPLRCPAPKSSRSI